LARKIRNPIESVELRVSIRADRATAERIRELFPSAKVRNGSCELKVVGERPADVAAKAEEMMQKLRGVVASPKDFKNPERSSVQK
jgi:hypothetical protein